MKELIAKYKEWVKAGHDKESIRHFLDMEKGLTDFQKAEILNQVFKKK